MAAFIKLNDIDEAITNLNYKNKDTLKYKLVHAIRRYYANETLVDVLQGIDADELVKTLWCTGEDPELIKSKRKNLSSIKSGVNADLKKLYQKDKNPQGIIIGQNNVFDMSDEAKDKALETVGGVLKDKGADTIAKIIEALNAVNDILSKSDSFSEGEGGLDQRDRMKDLISELSGRMGFSLSGDAPVGSGNVAPPGDEMGKNEEESLTDTSEDVTEEIVTEEEAIVSEEVIEESADELEDDLSTEVMEEIEEDGSLQELDQDINDEVIEEIVDDVEADVFEGAAAEIGGDLETDETEDGRGEGIDQEFQGDAIEEITDEESQDLDQSSEIIDETDSPGMFDEGDAVDEAIEGLIDETVGEESDVEGELEEIEADADSEEGEYEESGAGQEDILEEVDEDDLYDKAEILSKLAEAAKVLERLGPDLNDSLYSEREIKEKAKLLSEEFERDLSVREKFFNQHILIKAGEYCIGGKNGGKNELPEQKVHLPDFYIGKFPVTNTIFEIFVEKTGYRTTAEKNGYGYVYSPRAQRVKDWATGTEQFVWINHLQYKKVKGACWYHPNGPESSLYNKRRHPVVQVSLEDARAFAAWTGKRIPNEKEWEASARTARGYIYPWGNEWKDNSCNIEKSYFGDTTPVDKYIEFENDSGMADTLGNVLEWTLDHWRSPQSGEDNAEMYVAKGGSWISDSSLRLPSRYPIDKNIPSNILGFRCVAI